MATLTKEELFGKTVERQTETIRLPYFGGDVIVGGIMDASEYTQNMDRVGELMVQVPFPGSISEGLSIEILNACGMVATGTIEPKLTVDDVVKLLPSIGIGFQKMLGTVLRLSGMTQPQMDEKEAALKANSFPAGDVRGGDRVSEKASGRSESDNPAVVGTDDVLFD